MKLNVLILENWTFEYRADRIARNIGETVNCIEKKGSAK